MTNEWKAYYRALERRLECPKAAREEFLSETRRAAENFMEENPEAGFSDVERFLGQPEELARTYNETLGAEVTEKFRKRKRLKWGLLWAAVILIVAAAVVHSVWLQNRHHDIVVTEEKTITIYETEEGGDK